MGEDSDFTLFIVFFSKSWFLLTPCFCSLTGSFDSLVIIRSFNFCDGVTSNWAAYAPIGFCAVKVEMFFVAVFCLFTEYVINMFLASFIFRR